MSSGIGREEQKEKVRGRAVDRAEIDRVRQPPDGDERRADRRCGFPSRSVQEGNAVHRRRARELFAPVDPVCQSGPIE